MASESWQAIKNHVFSRADGCCEYCQTCQINIGQAMHVEHIDPNGGDGLDNLCLACPSCNLSKAAATTAVDPQSDHIVTLFNPRLHEWDEHFEWSEAYSHIQGLTAVGRATVVRLKMNRPRMVLTRQRWVQAKLHPVNK